MGPSIVSVQQADKSWVDTVYSEHFSCALHPESALEEIGATSFFLQCAPRCACPTCHGIGVILEFDPELILPDPENPSAKGASHPGKRQVRAVALRGAIFVASVGISAYRRLDRSDS